METMEAIRLRRSIRKYKDTPISDEDLSHIIVAGMTAPSVVDLQPWYFVVFKSEEKKAELRKIMADVAVAVSPILKERFKNNPEVAEESVSFIRQLGGAPVYVLCFAYQPHYDKSDSAIIQSVSAAAENMLIAAADRGIGSCWLSAPLETPLKGALEEAFGQGHGQLICLLTLGYPDQEPRIPKKKEGRFAIL